MLTVDAAVSCVKLVRSWPPNKGVTVFSFAAVGIVTLVASLRKVAAMTHRILVPHAPEANRALIRRPLWLIVMFVALWLSVLLLAMQAYPQSAGTSFQSQRCSHDSGASRRCAANVGFTFASTNRVGGKQN